VKHPEYFQLLSYASGRADETEVFQISRHAAGCESCTDTIRTLYELKGNFKEYWSAWIPRVHGGAVQWQGALEKLSENFRETTSEYIWSRLKSRATPVFQFLIDARKRFAAASANLPDKSFISQLEPALTGIGSPDQEAQYRRHVDESSRLLALNRSESAALEMEKASKINPFYVQSARMDIVRDNHLFLSLTADSRKRRMLLHYWPGSSRIEYRGVLLQSGKAGAVPEIAAFVKPEGLDHLILEFTSLPDTKFDLYLIPIKEKHQK